MNKITLSTKILVISSLFMIVLFIITRHKTYNYEKTTLIEYNAEYNEKFPAFDTIPVLYNNINKTNPILIRKFVIGGHNVIGEINGGSRTILIHDFPNCEKCLKFFVTLNSER